MIRSVYIHVGFEITQKYDRIRMDTLNESWSIRLPRMWSDVRFVNIRDKEEPVLLNEILRSWDLKEGRLVIIANRLRKRRESYLIFSLVGPWRA